MPWGLPFWWHHMDLLGANELNVNRYPNIMDGAFGTTPTNGGWRLVDINRPTSLVPSHGPLTRYVKWQVAHAPGMPGTFSPSPRVSDPDMHHGTYVTPVPWFIPSSLTSGSLWNWWRGKRSRHSRRMHNPQFYLSGKRPMQSTRQLTEDQATTSL